MNVVGNMKALSDHSLYISGGQLLLLGNFRPNGCGSNPAGYAR